MSAAQKALNQLKLNITALVLEWLTARVLTWLKNTQTTNGINTTGSQLKHMLRWGNVICGPCCYWGTWYRGESQKKVWNLIKT